MPFKHSRLQQGDLILEDFFHTYDLGDGKGNTYWNGALNIASSAGAVNSSAMTNSTLYAVPLWFGRRFRVKQFGVLISSITTGGFDITFGIYEDTWDTSRDFRYPGLKVVDYNITNITTTGFKSCTLSTPKILNANKLYWAALMKNNVGACSMGRTGFYRYPILHTSLDWSYPNQFANGMYVATTFGASLPDPYPASATEERFSFMMFIREPNQNGT